MNKVLYFIRGSLPTEAQRLEAEKLGAVFRNAGLCGESDFIENCYAVAGEIPPAYALKYPKAAAMDVRADSPVKDTLAEMTVNQLKDFAQSQGISIPGERVKGKQAVLAFIKVKLKEGEQ